MTLQRQSRSLQAGLLAAVLAVSSFSMATAGTRAGMPACCVRVDAAAPVSSGCHRPAALRCCAGESRPDAPATPARTPAAPHPDVQPLLLPAAALPSFLSPCAIGPVPIARRLVDSPPLYLLNAVLLV